MLLGRQTWPADLAGRLGRQTWPADLAGRLGRQTWLADLAGRLVKIKDGLKIESQHCIGPCHVRGIPLQKGKNPFGKGEKWRCLTGEERRLPFEGKKIPAHMTRAIVSFKKQIKNHGSSH
jgi:hypothetical protein